MKFETLTDLQWEKIKHLLPAPLKRGRGKPHTPWRYVVNSILFVLCNKAKWGAWPKTEQYSSKSAAHRWYLIWDKDGLLNQMLTLLAPNEVAHPQRRHHGIKEVEELEMTEEVPLFFEIEKREIPAFTG